MNIQKLISQAKGNAVSFAWLFGALAVGILAVGGDGFADIAKTKFWWSFWGIACVVAWVIAIVAFAYAWSSQKTDKKP